MPGTVGRRATSTATPSGTLRETATDLINDGLPDYTVDQYKHGILYFQHKSPGPRHHAVFDPGCSVGCNAVKAYEELAKAASSPCASAVLSS